MADNAMTAGARSAALIDEDIACAVPELSESGDKKFESLYENIKDKKDKIVNYMRESTSRQSTGEDNKNFYENIRDKKDKIVTYMRGNISEQSTGEDNNNSFKRLENFYEDTKNKIVTYMRESTSK